MWIKFKKLSLIQLNLNWIPIQLKLHAMWFNIFIQTESNFHKINSFKPNKKEFPILRSWRQIGSTTYLSFRRVGPTSPGDSEGRNGRLLGRDADKASQCARVCGSVFRNVLLHSEERRFFCKENFPTMVRIVSLLIPVMCCYRISVSLFFSVFLLFSVFSFPRNSAYCMVFFFSPLKISVLEKKKNAWWTRQLSFDCAQILWSCGLFKYGMDVYVEVCETLRVWDTAGYAR
jgi:hypothetical protein